MNLLALDIATKTGFAVLKNSEIVSSGTINLKEKTGCSYGVRLLNFKSFIEKTIQEHDINVIAYERSAGRHIRPIQTQSELIGVFILIAQEKDIDYIAYSASEIKNSFTGKGNAKKQAMVDEAIKKHPKIKVVDDNHADALAIVEHHLKTY